jgi:FHA domain
MATCSSGHESASDDFCDVCGFAIGPPIGGALGSGARGSGVTGAGVMGGGVMGGGLPGEVCSGCGASRTGKFCETCGYNFTAGGLAPPPVTRIGPRPAPSVAPLAPLAPPASAAPPASVVSAAPTPLNPQWPSESQAPPRPSESQPPPQWPSEPQSSESWPFESQPSGPQPAQPGPIQPSPPAATDWTAVVNADRAYYDRVQATGAADIATIAFPVYCPERRFRLSGPEARVGRRSARTGIDPEIDLTGPPADPGVSRLHAVLIKAADGSWSVIDPGSANGTQVNGAEIPRDRIVPLRDGDRIHLGAWTELRIVSEG